MKYTDMYGQITEVKPRPVFNYNIWRESRGTTSSIHLCAIHAICLQITSDKYLVELTSYSTKECEWCRVGCPHRINETSGTVYIHER